MDRSRESPLNPTESRFARGLNESFATHSLLKADKSQTRRSLEQVAYQHGECGKRSTLSEESEGKKGKGGRGGNRLKGWMLAVPRCSGGLSSEHF